MEPIKNMMDPTAIPIATPGNTGSADRPTALGLTGGVVEGVIDGPKVTVELEL